MEGPIIQCLRMEGPIIQCEFWFLGLKLSPPEKNFWIWWCLENSKKKINKTKINQSLLHALAELSSFDTNTSWFREKYVEKKALFLIWSLYGATCSSRVYPFFLWKKFNFFKVRKVNSSPNFKTKTFFFCHNNLWG